MPRKYIERYVVTFFTNGGAQVLKPMDWPEAWAKACELVASGYEITIHKGGYLR